jgi:GntR family transcriptional regulator
LWAAGDRIPPEPQLAKEFGVGIGTIRRAVEELVAERLLIRRAGRGTLVAKFTDEHAFDLYFNFVDATGTNIGVSAQLLTYANERANAALAARLNVARGARVVRVENLRRLGPQAVMLDRLWFPVEIFQGLDAASFAARRGSIYGYYQERYGVSVVRISEDLGAAHADEAVAAALEIDTGAPILRIERTAFTFQDKVVEFRVRSVNSQLCSYRNVRGLQD